MDGAARARTRRRGGGRRAPENGGACINDGAVAVGAVRLNGDHPAPARPPREPLVHVAKRDERHTRARRARSGDARAEVRVAIVAAGVGAPVLAAGGGAVRAEAGGAVVREEEQRGRAPAGGGG